MCYGRRGKRRKEEKKKERVELLGLLLLPSVPSVRVVVGVVVGLDHGERGSVVLGAERWRKQRVSDEKGDEKEENGKERTTSSSLRRCRSHLYKRRR